MSWPYDPYDTTEILVAYRVGCRVPPGWSHPSSYRLAKMWCDQLTPPPGWLHPWPDPDRPYAHTWHSQSQDAVDGAPTARAEQATHFTGIPLDVGRCTWTYRSCTLVGQLPLRQHRYAPRPITAADASDVLLSTLAWTLSTVYGISYPPGGLDRMPLPGLRFSVTERARTTITITPEDPHAAEPTDPDRS